MRITMVLLAVALVSTGSALSGAVPAKWMEEARQDAAMHLQVEITEVSVPPKTPGKCGVTGTVGQIFDDRVGLLEVGRTIQIGVTCYRADDEVSPSGRPWILVADLQAASFLEAYLDLRADSHHPAAPTLNYALSPGPVEQLTLVAGRRETHFVVKMNEVSFEGGSREATVEGPVSKVFRDQSGLLSPDRQLRLTLDCDTRWTLPCRAIKEAKGQYAEVTFYLNSPLDQVGIIEGLTEEPTCPRDAEGYWCDSADQHETGVPETP